MSEPVDELLEQLGPLYGEDDVEICPCCGEVPEECCCEWCVDCAQWLYNCTCPECPQCGLRLVDCTCEGSQHWRRTTPSPLHPSGAHTAANTGLRHSVKRLRLAI